MNPRKWSYFARLLGTVALFTLLATAKISGQTPQLIASQINGSINEAQRTTLLGDLHPLAKAEFDQGAVEPSQPSGRLMLVLKRSAEKQAALNQFLADAHNPESASYHRWITPDQFGSQFGPSKADLQAASAWLQSHGLTVAKVRAGGTAIEFAGTVGQINETFHTTIHIYKVNGEIHHANATNPQIPAALAGLVAGVTQLNDFYAQPLNRVRGKVQYSTLTHEAKPLWTVPVSGKSYPDFYLMTPEDFAVQYDVKPVYSAGINGTGTTIGILSDSNIDVSVVNHYRALFGLPVNPPQVVIDGSDPGMDNSSLTEAYLDVENAGAIAPNATVILYTAGTVSGADGINFSMARAIEDDTATVLSLSYGTCELALTTAGNTLINEMWEQAAAQGQTVLVSSGDTGSAGCDNNGSSQAEHGLAVNGMASTSWNIAVGGTDAYYSDYAKGGASLKTYWKSSNDSKHGSLQKPFPEQPWNDSVYGFNLTAYDSKQDQQDTTAAGGGGVSSCTKTQSTADPFGGTDTTCIANSGRPKPTWQKASGVPKDGVRDVPDVSLFSADGANGAAWLICVSDTDCVANSKGVIMPSAVGGTSAAAPAMAGIMALVNQKFGAQGQANFILYPLAAQYPKTFNNVDLGSNNVPCDQYASLSTCVLDTDGDGYYSQQNYYAGKGYDMASGLGTINVGNLIANWGKISLASTKTALTLSKTTITHGQSIAAAVKVTSSESGTPTGGVSLLATTPLQANTSQALLTLNSKGTATQSIDFLPGGSYSVYARYGGDGIFAGSRSTSIPVSIAPEACKLNASVSYYSAEYNKYYPLSNKTTFGIPIIVDIQPSGVSAAKGMANGAATGTATYFDSTDGGKTKTILATVPLNSEGIAEYAKQAFGIGPHLLTIAYSGDASFKLATTSTPINFTVGKGSTYMFFQCAGVMGPTCPSIPAKQSYTLAVAVGTTVDGQQPTGNVSIVLDGGKPVTVKLPADNYASYTLPALSAGKHTLMATYPGDTNYSSSTVSQTITATASKLQESTTTLTFSPSNPSANTPVTFTVTVKGGKGSTKAPTGSVTIYDGLWSASITMKLTPGKNATSTASTTTLSGLGSGYSALIASYTGDGNYNSTTSNIVLINGGSESGAKDFLLLTQSGNVSVASGATATTALNLAAVNEFSDNVSLTCKTASGLTCAVTPSTVKLSGHSTASVAINAYTQSSAKKASAPAGNYAALITGTSAHGVSHNARINVMVH